MTFLAQHCTPNLISRDAKVHLYSRLFQTAKNGRWGKQRENVFLKTSLAYKWFLENHALIFQAASGKKLRCDSLHIDQSDNSHIFNHGTFSECKIKHAKSLCINRKILRQSMMKLYTHELKRERRVKSLKNDNHGTSFFSYSSLLICVQIYPHSQSGTDKIIIRCVFMSTANKNGNEKRQ